MTKCLEGTRNRIARLISSSPSGGQLAYPLAFWLEKLELKPSFETFEIIRQLEREGYLQRIYRVESARLGGLGDFVSRTEIPNTIDDFRTGELVRVSTDNIKVLYVANINHKKQLSK